MGSRAGLKNEKPVHKVTVNSYWIGKYEVTVAEFSKFVGETGYMTDAEKNGYASVYIEGKWVKKVGVDWRCNEEGKKRHMNTNKYPVIFVSWNDANAYCRWLSQKTGYNYRLPTEVEWEYADRDRGLNNRRWSGTNNANKVKEYAWSKANSKGKVHPIGKRKPNDLQLYDMSGNVWEWCADWYSSNYYSVSRSVNPKGPSKGERRVLRGGSWIDEDNSCRSTFRYSSTPKSRVSNIGFRYVCTR